MIGLYNPPSAPVEFNEGDDIPAIPPEDYIGTQAEWMVGLQERGLWDGEGWHGDVMISHKEWCELLEECEDGK